MPNSSQPYASLLPQFDLNILPDFSKFDISKIDFSLFSPDLLKSFDNLNLNYQNTMIELGGKSKPNSSFDFIAKNQMGYSKIALLRAKKVAQEKAKDPNEVLIDANVDNELEGTMPDKIEVPKTDQFRDIINGAGSVNQSVGKYGDLAILAGQVLGGMIGGLAGTAISRAATGTLTSINAIKNLKSLHKLEDGVPGLGTARAGNIASLAGAITSVADSFLGPKSEYSGDKGNITEGLDSLYDSISDAAMTMGPAGMIVGGAMKVGDFIGDGLNKLGIGTDGMTTQDAILGSSFFSWNIGLANSIGAKKTDTITKDNDIFANIGSSYTGTNYKVDDAVTKSGKKYGWLSRNAYNKANSAINEAKRLLNVMSGISDEATDRRNLRNSMSAFNGIRREYELQGGYNQANIRVGKEGLKFELTFEGELPNLIFNGELPLIFKFGGELPKLLFGGEMPISKYLKFIESLPDNLKPKEGDNYNMKLLWELNGKPESFNDVKGIIFTYNKKDKSWHAPSVAYNEDKDEYIFLKSLNYPTYNKELEWYFSPEAAEFRSKYKYDPISNKYLPIIPKSMLMLKKGGEFNVIPDGALHARKHHMDMKGITLKGIPVVDNEGNLTAEIEKEEIIFRLSVTEELEKLNKIYQSSNSKKKEKEEAALKAGKLLVYEILNNTIDNTNLIENAT